MFEKIWEKHVVHAEAGKPSILYIDLHLVHEVTSPQAFDGLRLNGRPVRRPDKTVAVMDHNVPTWDRSIPTTDEIAAKQMEALAKNCQEFGITLYDLFDPRQGIVHIIGPQMGLTQPGMTIVCGDSHTSTHGAFGSIAFGIGTSEVELVLATQCLTQSKPKTMYVDFQGELPPWAGAKDMILALIGKIGTAGATGYAVEYGGAAVRGLNMDERMTICNMSIEAGARCGMVAPDETTFEYMKGRPLAPQGAEWEQAVAAWRQSPSDPGASFDTVVTLDVSQLAPQVSWGTNPGMMATIDDRVPSPDDFADLNQRKATERALEYMGLQPGTPLQSVKVDRVFIGSCTNGRLTDLRAAARAVKGKQVAAGVRAMVVPGSHQVILDAEKEGLDRIFREAGFEWREAGCSMCLGMNPDILSPGERCASTSNRNFEGRQGKGGRTHLVSPMMAAAAAITGHFTDVRTWKFED